MNTLTGAQPRRRGRPKPSVIADKYRIGRIQRQLRGAMIAAGGKPLGISDLLVWCYPATKQHPRWPRPIVHRALPRFAVSLGRIPDRPGRPCVFAPNAELRRLICRASD